MVPITVVLVYTQLSIEVEMQMGCCFNIDLGSILNKETLFPRSDCSILGTISLFSAR